MRFYLLSKSDLFGNLNLNRLVPLLARKHEIHIFLSDRIFPDELDNPYMRPFMHFSRDYLLGTFFPYLDDQCVDRKNPPLLSFNALSRKYGAQLVNLGDAPENAIKILDEYTRTYIPDVFLCCRHDFIIPPRIYQTARLGSYNTHSGGLPGYRGPSCSFWAMRNGEKEGMCSIHTLKEKVDTGEIVAIGKTVIKHHCSLLKNLTRIYAAGMDALEEMLPQLERGPLPGIAQPRGYARYYPAPNTEDCRAFIEQGGRMVDDDEFTDILRKFLPATGLAESIPDFRISDIVGRS